MVVDKKRILGSVRSGLLFIISAPAGTGKTSLTEKLIAEFPGRVVRSISCTTRTPREGEVEGRDYFFLTPQDFEQRAAHGEFLEHATMFGERYGTLESFVRQEQQQGKHLLLVIDTQGAASLKAQGEPGVFIFISPPSLGELRKRLAKRNTEESGLREGRIRKAEQEIEQIQDYDYHFVNDHFDTAYEVLKSIVIAEGHRRVLDCED